MAKRNTKPPPVAQVVVALAAAEALVKQARNDLLTTQFWFGYIMLKLKLELNRKFPRGATDGTTMWINPEYASQLGQSRTRTLIAHEVLHVANKHHLRRGTRIMRLWRKACDLAINPVLVDSGFEPIEGWLYEHRFRGWSAERIYATLLEEEQAQEEQQQPSSQPTPQSNEGGEEKGRQGSGGPSEEKEDEDEENQEDGTNSSQGSPDSEGDQEEEGYGTSGSGQEGESEQGEDSAGPGGAGNGDSEEEYVDPCGELLDAPQPKEDEEAPMSETDWDLTVHEATKAAKAAGSMPQAIQGMLATLQQSQVDWREQAANFMLNQSADDYSYRRLNRSFQVRDMVAPSLYSERMGEAVFVGDVSGSVSDREFNAMASEVVAGASQLDCERLHFIQFDAGIRSHEIIEPGDDFTKVRRMGSGGTLFRPVFDYIKAQGIEPEWMVFLTDMEPCDEWPEEPDYPVLWVSTTPNKVAPWGDTIFLLDGGEHK